MVPKQVSAKHDSINDMMCSGERLILEMAEAASCNKTIILRISSNIRMLSSVKASPNEGGPSQSITPVIIEALFDHLLEG
jgi:hypothetical protein